MTSLQILQSLKTGTVIPASPLALDADRKWDSRRQRALWRYYSASGAGGVAVGVHTTQFAIRDPKYNLFKPLLEFASEELCRLDAVREAPLIRVAGICGGTDQAVAEAETAQTCGFHFGLLNLSAWKDAGLSECIEHCHQVAKAIPLFGFYLQPAIGGRPLPYEFWRRFLEIEQVAAIKVATFDRYQTLEVVRAVVDSGRDDVALYTGNDDNFIMDLISDYTFTRNCELVHRNFVGGLLGHWACWTHSAVKWLQWCHDYRRHRKWDDFLWELNTAQTDAHAVIFDSANEFAGCIPGVHDVLRRQGLLEDVCCLEPNEQLSPGQAEGIERVIKEYKLLNDDAFVAEHLDEWLAD